MGRVVGEQVRVGAQFGADCGQLGLDLLQVVGDQRAGVRVDGQPAVLVGLGGLADALAAADHVVDGDMDQGLVQVGVADLQAAQLAAAYAGDRHQPQIQAQGGTARATAITVATSSGEVAGMGWRVVVGGLADSAGLRSVHSQRWAAANAPDRMLWIPWMVLACIGRQTCGLHPARRQSWPGPGRLRAPSSC